MICIRPTSPVRLVLRIGPSRPSRHSQPSGRISPLRFCSRIAAGCANDTIGAGETFQNERRLVAEVAGLPPQARNSEVVMPSMGERILQLFAERGRSAYLGEAVTQEEHALQAAWAAEKAGADAPLIVAALLHDVGHLLHDLDHAAERGVDDCHEERGRLWLEEHFAPAVSEPVRLHVAAKRYLCVAEPGYFGRLSPASVLSLELQGGPMTEDEATAFRAGPFSAAAIALRRWD